jgi:hypothetical protein
MSGTITSGPLGTVATVSEVSPDEPSVSIARLLAVLYPLQAIHQLMRTQEGIHWIKTAIDWLEPALDDDNSNVTDQSTKNPRNLCDSERIILIIPFERSNCC